jgi:HSP20 family molecular chaperone IbpA
MMITTKNMNKEYGYTWIDRNIHEELNLLDTFWDTRTKYYSYVYDKDNKQYTISIDVPGYDKSEMSITYTDSQLDFSANNKQRGDKIYCFTLYKKMDLDKIVSKLQNGVLTIM